MKLFAWWRIAWPIWTVILAGFLWCVLSLFLPLGFSPSGSVLVCAALIAGVLNNRFSWRQAACAVGVAPLGRCLDEATEKEYYRPIIRDESNGETQRSWGTPLIPVNVFDNLREFSSSGDYHDGEWMVANALSRVDCLITWAICIAAVLGTAIWGYGDLICPTKKSCLVFSEIDAFF